MEVDFSMDCILWNAEVLHLFCWGPRDFIGFRLVLIFQFGILDEWLKFGPHTLPLNMVQA